jgi:hypothetical protein
VSLNATPNTQPGNVDLKWSSATGEYFSVVYSTTLPGGFSIVVRSNILATPPTNLVTLPVTDKAGFFRLKF